MRGNSNQKWPTNNTNDFICRQWYLKSYYDCIPCFYEARDIKDIKKETSWRWPVSAVGLSIVPIHQDCSCRLQSGAHRTQARGAYVSETASRCSLSLCHDLKIFENSDYISLSKVLYPLLDWSTCLIGEDMCTNISRVLGQVDWWCLSLLCSYWFSFYLS